MSLRAAASGLVVILLSLPVVHSDSWGVTCSPPHICAVKGSSVKITCTYEYPVNTYNVLKILKTFWFVKETNEIFVDLKTDPQYLGRVTYDCTYTRKCILTITDVRASDSAQYKFRFVTNQQSGKYTGEPGVTLSVTDLQVQVTDYSSYSTCAELRCVSSCPLPAHLTYIWYNSGQEIHGNSNTYSGCIGRTDSYSCAVKGQEAFPSPTVADVWGVTYASTHICAFKGSAVKIDCTFRYPSKINNLPIKVTHKFWFVKINSEPVPLNQDNNYMNRVDYQCDGNSCSLTIKNLRETDSAHKYKFRFITNKDDGKYTGEPGVTVSVSDPQFEVHVRKSVTQYSSWIELTCCSGCQQPDVAYIWYRNTVAVPKAKRSYFLLDSPNPSNSEYSCAMEGYEGFRSPSVYAPRPPSVLLRPSGEIVEGSSVTLTCSSEANPAANYTWYKNQTLFKQEPQLVFSSIQSSDSGQYHCAAENELGRRTSHFIFISVKYGPRPPSVSVRPSGEIVEGSSVNLTCSSEANPAANYTWYKNQTLLRQGPQLVFRSIQSSDSGEYHCAAENNIGCNTSGYVLINVKYPPHPPSVSVRPSADIVEGSSVTLTCSSDANPAANYTWYKEKRQISCGQKGICHFFSISSNDTGFYYCESVNQYGKNSTYESIDVQYPPRPPSVSVRPSAEIVEGSSVNLTCSSDANPAANYTWYKENEESPKASGQIFIITDIRPEHSGKYCCEAWNSRGRHNNTFTLTVVADLRKALKSAAVGIFPVVVLVVVVILIFLLMRKKRTSKQSEPEERPENRVRSRPHQSEDQDDVQYASIHFRKAKTNPIYSNITSAGARRPKDEEDESVEYAAVQFMSTAPRPNGPVTMEDSSPLYSTVNNIR